MARSLCVDFRGRVVDTIESGLSCRATALRFGVSASSAIRWRLRERREGDISLGPSAKAATAIRDGSSILS